MAEASKRRNLGRGLSALLGAEKAAVLEPAAAESSVHPANNAAIAPDSTVVPVQANGNQRLLAVASLVPGKYQPRHHFDVDHIESLAQSIREKGVLQPILVRPHPQQANHFEIIAGERRWQAAQKAQLHQVPVIIKEMDDREAAEIALVENLQRQDLSPIEEAEGYRRLMDDFDHTQDALAQALGKSRSHVANMMRLLNLPSEVKSLLEGGDLTIGHARALLNCTNPSEVAKQVVKKGLNVRQTEALAKKAGVQARKPLAKSAKDADTVSLERDLTNLLGLNVEITSKAKGGTISLHYSSLEQLDQILSRLSHGQHGQGGFDSVGHIEEEIDDAEIDAELARLAD